MDTPEFDPTTLAALRARAGDRAAAAEFVRLTQTDVWRLCANLGSAADADDLTQETFARAFASLHRFAGRSTARTWLLSIARRVCADAIRHRRPVVPMASVEPLQRGGDPADTVGLRMLLDALEPAYREAFVLTQLLGLTYPEAADVVGCPTGTIRSRVARARDGLVRGLGSSRRADGTAG
ncbi:sigma-70 family RNA polymerase sigma factor [Jatrophihabitans telluris]|uniref:RNA polymerase sigma factor n=1 Tax=Jatrophihabitans telluris TaxID=2038343 RepID=A0ABY4QXP2_9ACTN|nr:sigma-70 family RNA polymerase sigma factor [Jatrophihabitans telluris]UQX87660.1 sigma-70 family RNA polymerase sigma factor [Jatrophihabitans telluris]